MPKIHLRPQFVANPPKPKDKAKIDYFDSALPGFLLEVRKTGTVLPQKYKTLRFEPQNSLFSRTQ